jgi:hypothetical protein
VISNRLLHATDKADRRNHKTRAYQISACRDPEVTNNLPHYDALTAHFMGLKADTRLQTCMASLFTNIVYDRTSA